MERDDEFTVTVRKKEETPEANVSQNDNSKEVVEKVAVPNTSLFKNNLASIIGAILMVVGALLISKSLIKKEKINKE